MSDIMAAIGKEQLKNFDYHKTRRQELAKCYVELLNGVSSISIFNNDYEHIVPHIFVVLLDEGIDRKSLIDFLKKNDIPSGIHYKPNHLHSYFADDAFKKFPTTDMLYKRMLTLPLHPELSFEDISKIINSLKQGIENVKSASG